MWHQGQLHQNRSGLCESNVHSFGTSNFNSNYPTACNSYCGSRDGAVVRALASHQCGPGSIPGLGVTNGLSLLLVLVPAPRVFLRVLRFSSLHKNQHFQIPIRPGNSGEKSHSMDSTEIPIYLFIYLFVCLFVYLFIYYFFILSSIKSSGLFMFISPGSIY